MDGLTRRIHNLPPEIFSLIYGFVTTIDSKLTIDITPTYHPPAILQLDRASREEVSAQYYGRGTTFRFTNANENLVLKWLVSVPTRFRFQVDRIELGHGRRKRGVGRATMKAREMAALAKLEGLLFSRRVFFVGYDVPLRYRNAPLLEWRNRFWVRG
ncbi:hypothetical protein CERZMDRAFT_93229 [Cercospora zeae-maydis SCOH1-5]|uniref:Uncharacterized protein n=1 Tax=Cercospora zeae-maydis SCOH1-5 TaxID=717836 RepID=A0A6A6FUM6_9PEZI|nr:hypothetical protein CERZMDRAFT_93229 [Cercospora zeae-maydis SCOH1-5]